MYRYELVEADIVARLKPLADAGATVVVMPQNEQEFKRAVSLPRVTVLYMGSKYDPPQSTAQISQHETANFLILVEATTRRGTGPKDEHTGVLALAQAVRVLLLGYRPLGKWGRLHLVDSQMGERDKDTSEWRFELAFSSKFLVVEGGDCCHDDPLLTRVTMNGEPLNQL